jgi:hypothetical protein
MRLVVGLGLLGLLAACGSGGGFPDAREIDAAPPTGTFTLDWSVSDPGGQAITCDQVGGQTVTVLAHNRAFEGGETEPFVCSTLMGQSPGLAPGTYDFEFELDASSGILATAPGQYGIEIASNQNVRLAPLAFSLDATGAMNLHLATNRAGGNCGVPPNGGGITSTTITLVHSSDLSCQPLTLQIAAGATKPQTMYVINCATPAVGPCIESDQAITATGFAADNYQIHIQMNQATNLCWTNNDSIVVPPLGATLMRTLNLLFASGNAACM